MSVRRIAVYVLIVKHWSHSLSKRRPNSFYCAAEREVGSVLVLERERESGGEVGWAPASIWREFLFFHDGERSTKNDEAGEGIFNIKVKSELV
jgi:hypothetical protein